MLSLDTSTLLCEFLHKVSSLERQVEVTRQVLSELFDFEPYSVFKLVDRGGYGALGSEDLKGFLEGQRIVARVEEAEAAIRQYDANGDARLSLSEFYNLVLPATSPTRREIVLSRTPLSSVSSDVLYAFSRLLEREFLYHRELTSLRLLLTSNPDFTVLSAFHAIDTLRLSYLDRISIRDFLIRNRFAPYEEDLDAIFRRIDSDGDGRISYLEFVEAVVPKLHSYDRVSSALDRRTSPLKTRKSLSPDKEMTFSPVRRGKRTQTPAKRGSPLRGSGREDGNRYKTPEKKSRKESGSPLRASKGKSFTRSERLNFSPLPPHEESELILALKQQVDICRDLETSKIDLVLMPDFNLIDSFRLFDSSNKGFVTPIEMEDGMRLLGVRALRDETSLLIRNYSKLTDSRLRFSDYAEMMTPKESEYRRMVEGRRPYRGRLDDPRSAFSQETLRRLGLVMRMQLECEGLAEGMRQRLSRRPRFSFYEAFQTIDKDRNGFITYDEFQSILEENGILTTAKDLKSLMDRYDKNRDGRVSYSEFVQEVTPKSPSKY